MASSTNGTTSPSPPPRPPAATDDQGRAGATDATADDRPQLLAFVAAGRLFGCPLADVREIIPSRATTRLPGAPPHVLGLLNLRGTLLTVLDLALALGAQQEPAPASPTSRDGDSAPPALPALPAPGALRAPALPHSRTPAPGALRAPALDALRAPASEGHVLVVEVDGRRVGCRADAVRRVYPMPALIPPTVVGNVLPPGIVLGIGDAGDIMVAVLDLPALARQTLLFSGER